MKNTFLLDYIIYHEAILIPPRWKGISPYDEFQKWPFSQKLKGSYLTIM